jgi:hypothetical protein
VPILRTVFVRLERVSWFVSCCPRCSFSFQPLLTKLLLCCRRQLTCIWRTHSADILRRPLLSVRSCRILVMRSYPWGGSRYMIVLDLGHLPYQRFDFWSFQRGHLYLPLAFFPTTIWMKRKLCYCYSMMLAIRANEKT